MSSNTSSEESVGGSHLDLDSRLRAEIRNIGIPPRPIIIDRIHGEMHKDEPDFTRLAEIIGSDVGLAASVIKITNSPYFGLGKRVRSVPEALMVLGLRVILHTVAGLALKQTFFRVQHLERFWDSAARTARVAGWLAFRLRDRLRARSDDAYTFGLFRDCGIPVLMSPFPEYAGVLQEANNEPTRCFTEVEDGHLSINHAVIGAELAEDWLLPEELFQAVYYHHDLAAIEGRRGTAVGEASRELIAIVQVAEYLILTSTGLSHTNEWTKLGSACKTVLGIRDEEFAGLLADCQDAVTGKT